MRENLLLCIQYTVVVVVHLQKGLSLLCPHLKTVSNLMSFRPDGIGTVTAEEKERFEEIKERLRVLLENQITHFRYEAYI